MNFIKPGVGLDIHLFKENMSSFQVHSLTVTGFARSFVDGVFMNPLTAMSQNNILAVVVFAAFLGIAIVASAAPGQAGCRSSAW